MVSQSRNQIMLRPPSISGDINVPAWVVFLPVWMVISKNIYSQCQVYDKPFGIALKGWA